MLGVDIGAAAVKLLALSECGGRRQVEFYAMAPLPPNAVVEGQFRDVEAVGEAIRQALSGWRGRPKPAAAALAAACVRTKAFEVDAALTDEEIEALIVVEAERHLPCAINEAAYDFEVQGFCESGPGQVEVLLSACREEHLGSRAAALVAGGLRPVVMDTEAFALARALELCRPFAGDGGDGQAVAVLDLGSTLRLLVFDPSRCLYERGQAPPVGDSVAAPGNGDAQARCRTIAKQASEALRLFGAAQPHRPLSALVLAGGGTLLDGLTEALAAELALPVKTANPFQGMSVAVRVDAEALSRDAPVLMLACGLALRSSPGC